MMSALPQLVSKRSGSASTARAESAAADPLPTAAAGLAPVAAEAGETAGRSLVCCAFALTPRTKAPKKNAQKYLDFICSSLLAQIILETCGARRGFHSNAGAPGCTTKRSARERYTRFPVGRRRTQPAQSRSVSSQWL